MQQTEKPKSKLDFLRYALKKGIKEAKKLDIKEPTLAIPEERGDLEQDDE